MTTLIRQLGWQTVSERYQYFTAVLVFKCLNIMSLHTLRETFSATSTVHEYLTRASSHGNLYLPKPRTNFMKRRLCYTGSDIWNNLPSDLKMSIVTTSEVI